MLDNRWYRTVDKENGTILGEQQKYWLKEALLYSTAKYKFICVGGQVLSDFAGFENFANYKNERQEIIDFLDENSIKGVIFLTGDRHHSEITKLKTDKGNVFTMSLRLQLLHLLMTIPMSQIHCGYQEAWFLNAILLFSK